MCGRFTAISQEELEDVVRSVEEAIAASAAADATAAVGATMADGAAGLSPTASAPGPLVTPGSTAPVLVHAGPWHQEKGTCCGSGCGKCPWTRNPLAVKSMELTWGFEVDWQKQPVFNTRIEHAGDLGSMWAESLGHRHCVVPVHRFFEPHQNEVVVSPRTGKTTKRQYAFGPAEGSPLPWLLLAGVFSNDRFSVVTTEPNAVMRPIHDRMPLVLEPHEVATWLSPDYAQLADRSRTQLHAAPEHPDVPSFQQLTLF
ncbi:MAG: SOS response-associated peptidase family protein [Coriobacteriia bacterium]|nr:SOS response-associated peptidase family protein [Coriobacteriia bacterium]